MATPKENAPFLAALPHSMSDVKLRSSSSFCFRTSNAMDVSVGSYDSFHDPTRTQVRASQNSFRPLDDKIVMHTVT